MRATALDPKRTLAFAINGAMPTPEAPKLQYLVHTNRELGLMLRGLKPLASFVVENGPSCLTGYLRMFDRHVELGRFIKREIKTVRAGSAIQRVLYALPGEEWRIDAILRHYDEGWGCSDEGERREGSLLGYTECEIEAWLDHLREAGTLKFS